jgi:rubrerythrin
VGTGKRSVQRYTRGHRRSGWANICIGAISVPPRVQERREALLRIAADESRHGDWIAKKINEIAGSLPPELTISSTERNSWQYLLDDLEVERQCSAELETDMLTIASDYPEIVELLQRIDEEEHKHCDEIREMLMRIPRHCGRRREHDL